MKFHLVDHFRPRLPVLLAAASAAAVLVALLPGVAAEAAPTSAAAAAGQDSTFGYVVVSGKSSGPQGTEYVGSGAVPGARVFGPPTPTTIERERKLAETSGSRYKTDSAKYADKATSASPPYNPVTYTECQANASAATPAGFIKNHYAFCRRLNVVLGWKDSLGIVKGQVTFGITLIGFGSNEKREVLFTEVLDHFTTQGSFNDSTTLTADLPCVGYPGPTACTKGSPYGRTATIGSWKAVGSTTFPLTSSTVGSYTDKDKTAAGVFSPSFLASDGTHRPTTTGPEQGFRCDSAPYTRYKLGCIFDRTLAYLTYSVGDADVNESAQHIFDAQVQPQITYPMFAGKRVPGRLEGPYLHRIYYDTARQSRNTAAAKATCLSYYGTYNGTVLNCDEYPFKTTLEGAAFGDNNYSARVIDAKDNQRAGSRLGVWFGDDHILDGDGFAINITA